MNDSELEKRKSRAANETLIISQTEGGYRVYNPANITHMYMVSGIPESPKCTCPDFQSHQNDSMWRCKHILAVLNEMEKQRSETAPENPPDAKKEDTVQTEDQSSERKKPRALRNGHSQMLIKRSVSPDGRIDSLSVEFLSPIQAGSDEDIKQQAHRALMLQAEITNEFLTENGNGKANTGNTAKIACQGNANSQTQNGTKEKGDNSDSAVPAQLLNVAGMNTRGGWKFFINVQVNGRTTKLFGSRRDLGERVAAAGFPSMADHINQGMMLNLPCRVITKPSPDGKYLNIERVLPIQPLQTQGREKP